LSTLAVGLSRHRYRGLLCVCRLIEAYEKHQKLQQQVQVIKKHRMAAADASKYVKCWLLSVPFFWLRVLG